jgi:hypothetical protein
MIKIKKNKVPLLNRPSFLCDSKINDKLDNVDIYKLMNKSHFSCFIGLPGAGKSSMAISFLNSHQGFKRCYHNIILFCPSYLRAFIKDALVPTSVPSTTLEYNYLAAFYKANDKLSLKLVLPILPSYYK